MTWLILIGRTWIGHLKPWKTWCIISRFFLSNIRLLLFSLSNKETSGTCKWTWHHCLLCKHVQGRRPLVWITVYIQPSRLCALLMLGRYHIDAHWKDESSNCKIRTVSCHTNIAFGLAHIYSTKNYTLTHPHWLPSTQRTQYNRLSWFNAFCR